MRGNMKKTLAIVGLASCVAITAHAGDTSQVSEGLLACAKVQDPAARVRCYDAQVAAMKEAKGAAPAAAAGSSSGAGSTAAPAARSAARTPPEQPSKARENSVTARFGEEELPPSRHPQRNPNEETLSSSIAGVGKGPAGIYYFSLANGQVWRADGSQIALDPDIPVIFRIGAPIRITRGALGSYHMWAPTVGAKNWMYVRRIR